MRKKYNTNIICDKGCIRSTRQSELGVIKFYFLSLRLNFLWGVANFIQILAQELKESPYLNTE